MNRPEGVHNKVWNGYRNIAFCIIDYIVKQKGSTTLNDIETYTGLKKIGVAWAADVLRLLAKDGSVQINGNTVTANVEALTKIIKQSKVELPVNYGKKWSENDVIKLATLYVEGNHAHQIATKLERTENAVTEALSKLRFAYWLIPIIEKHSIVRECASEQKSANDVR